MFTGNNLTLVKFLKRYVRSRAFLRRSVSSSAEIREAFLKFYEQYDHAIVPSSKIFSPDDRSLLFVNAGMNQFKPIILGTASNSSPFHNVKRAANSQRCIRVGGKHNDLEDVGKDHTHHTFFEMLGSWSFGDYFKERACNLAWEFLVDVCKLPKEKLYITYFGGCKTLGLDPDYETQRVWLSAGIAPERILPSGPKDNFWEMGETGPCGPCTEIHFDTSEQSQFVPHLVNVDKSSVVEIWNLVFMQYNRLNQSKLDKLHSFHVDTGMGLERITTILQGKKSNYDTDLFMPIIKKLEQMSTCREYRGQIGDLDPDKIDQAYRVISDHIRMISVAICDDVYPGVRGRDLIVRQVLRRAVRQGVEVLNTRKMFLSQLVPIVVESLSCAMPSLYSKQQHIIEVVDEAEKSFYDVIKQGDKTISRTIQKRASSKFPVKSAQNLIYHVGYPEEYLLEKLRQADKTVDMEEVYKFKEGRQNPDLDTSEGQPHQGQINFLGSLKQSSFESFPKTEVTTSEEISAHQDWNHEVKVLACVLQDGRFGEETEDLSTLPDKVHLLLDRTIDSQAVQNHLPDILHICIGKKSYPVESLSNFEGWILHQISLSSIEDRQWIHRLRGNDARLSVNAANFRSAHSGYFVSQLLRQVLSDMGMTVLKTRQGWNTIRVEIAGNRTDDEINRILNAVSEASKNMAKGIAPIEDTVELCATKVNRLGNSRTVIKCLCVNEACDALRNTLDVQKNVDSLCEEIDSRALRDLETVDRYRKLVGSLTYRVNGSVMSYDVKLKCKQRLSKMTSQLNTKYKRLFAEKSEKHISA